MFCVNFSADKNVKEKSNSMVEKVEQIKIQQAGLHKKFELVHKFRKFQQKIKGRGIKCKCFRLDINYAKQPLCTPYRIR